MTSTRTTTRLERVTQDDLRTSRRSQVFSDKADMPTRNTLREDRTGNRDASQGYYHDWDVRHPVE
jgi:hypothetical protein